MISRILPVLMMGLAVCGTGMTQNHAETRKTLVGIQAVKVVVHGLSEELVTRGVTVEFVKNEVEAKLKEAGIKVLNKAMPPGFPILAVLANSIKVSGETPFYATSLRVELRQTATLTRDRRVESHNVTWSSSSMIAASRRLVKKATQETLGTLLGTFVKSHGAANTARRHSP